MNLLLMSQVVTTYRQEELACSSLTTTRSALNVDPDASVSESADLSGVFRKMVYFDTVTLNATLTVRWNLQIKAEGK